MRSSERIPAVPYSISGERVMKAVGSYQWNALCMCIALGEGWVHGRDTVSVTLGWLANMRVVAAWVRNVRGGWGDAMSTKARHRVSALSLVWLSGHTKATVVGRLAWRAERAALVMAGSASLFPVGWTRTISPVQSGQSPGATCIVVGG
jgi:hypothetical protein